MSKIGKLSYEYFFKPLGELNKWKDRGFNSSEKVKMLQNEMKDASSKIEVNFIEFTNDPLNLFFLSGKNHWYQTIFCLKSLEKVKLDNAKIFILDDGTLDKDFIEKIELNAKGLTFITNEFFLDVFSSNSGFKKFPNLYKAMLASTELKKLTYRFLNQNYTICIDSDILFYDSPFHFENFKQLNIPFSMKDIYPFADIDLDKSSKISNFKTIPYINAGIVGMDNSIIDWDELENWSKKLISEYGGVSFFIEQTLLSMMFSKNKNFEYLSTNEYILAPSRQNIIQNIGICHHYVGSHRDNYYLEAWKKFI